MAEPRQQVDRDEAPGPRSAAPDSDVLISATGLRKTFKLGLLRRKTVQAVRGVSFEVRRGQIVGFLGPNGSGKTTTIKMLLGLISASGGEAHLFGERVPSRAARQRLGFLPENPYVYPYLTPREFVELCGRLSGLGGKRVRTRAAEVLDRTGVLYAADRQVRRLSKGMLQRTALGAALVADPELLVLDEPMSGLDPVGRKEVRDILFAERDAGRTIFFSTHILSDVEAMCDHVVILRNGQVVVAGAIRQLLRGEVLRTDVTLGEPSAELRAALAADGFTVRERPGVVVVEVVGQDAVGPLLTRALAAGAQVVEVQPRRETLEDLFMNRAL
ncbi:MAG: ABC transporter ATP-binding protein [Myxococcales bacterium]|nr:ABC transporter ATP-binding protein [Myxococcales bacterium]